jgi:hypothetical protein
MDIHTRQTKGKFYNAGLILIGHGDIRQRVDKAFNTLLSLESQNFEDQAIYKEFQDLRDYVTGGIKVPLAGNMKDFIEGASDDEIFKIATRIYDIQTQL